MLSVFGGLGDLIAAITIPKQANIGAVNRENHQYHHRWCGKHA